MRPSAESVWNEHRESTRGRDLDITGLSYASLEAAPQQWPCPSGTAPTGRARLYEDGIFPTPDGRARFADTPYRALAEPRDARFPFALNTGRLRDQWHGMSRSGTLGRLFGHAAEPSIDMHPQDMARLGLSEGALAHVTSRRGSLLLPARASPQIALAQSFIAMHWGSEFLGGRGKQGDNLAGVNALTSPAHCPQSKQPELKHSAVKILKAELPWRLLALAWLPEEAALQARERLKPLLAQFDFATCVPFGHERSGVLFRAGAYEPCGDALLQRIEAVLGLDASDVVRYADKRRGQRRAMRLVKAGGEARETRLEAFLLAGDTQAESWIAPLLQQQLPAQAYGRFLLAPGAKAPLAIAPRSRQVCTCFDVSEDRIEAALRHTTGSAAARLASVQEQLKCGTNCGSCRPELERMVRVSETALAVVKAS